MPKMSKEEWKSVVDRVGYYEVSNKGRVRSLPGGHGRGKAGLILKAGINSGGYFGVVLAKGGKKEWRSIHRLVATAFCDNPNGHPVVNHIDHNKVNNTPGNLEWCTAKHNSQHAAREGRIRSGRSHPKAVGVKIYRDRKLIGRYDTITDAARAIAVSYPSLVACTGYYMGYRVVRLT